MKLGSNFPLKNVQKPSSPKKHPKRRPQKIRFKEPPIKQYLAQKPITKKTLNNIIIGFIFEANKGNFDKAKDLIIEHPTLLFNKHPKILEKFLNVLQFGLAVNEYMDLTKTLVEAHQYSSNPKLHAGLVSIYLKARAAVFQKGIEKVAGKSGDLKDAARDFPRGFQNIKLTTLNGVKIERGSNQAKVIKTIAKEMNGSRLSLSQTTIENLTSKSPKTRTKAFRDTFKSTNAGKFFTLFHRNAEADAVNNFMFDMSKTMPVKENPKKRSYDIVVEEKRVTVTTKARFFPNFDTGSPLSDPEEPTYLTLTVVITTFFDERKPTIKVSHEGLKWPKLEKRISELKTKKGNIKLYKKVVIKKVKETCRNIGFFVD